MVYCLKRPILYPLYCHKNFLFRGQRKEISPAALQGEKQSAADVDKAVPETFSDLPEILLPLPRLL